MQSNSIGAVIKEMKFSPVRFIFSIPTENSIVNTVVASKKNRSVFMSATADF